MNRQPEHLIYHWLRSMKIPVSGKYIKEKLLAHPDYPSLLSITDTLDELNIENGVWVRERQKTIGFLFNRIKFFVQRHSKTADAQPLSMNGIRRLLLCLFFFQRAGGGDLPKE